MKAHNNGLHLHASSFSGPAMGIEENAARVTCEGGAQVKPEPLALAPNIRVSWPFQEMR